MNRLLEKDRLTFETQYAGAERFLQAAHLRYEAFSLMTQNKLNKWETERLNELIQTHACKTQWFDNIKLNTFIA